jgi:hypothetical protein
MATKGTFFSSKKYKKYIKFALPQFKELNNKIEEKKSKNK